MEDNKSSSSSPPVIQRPNHDEREDRFMALLEMIVERLQLAATAVASPPKSTKPVADEPRVVQPEAPRQLAQELAQKRVDHKGKIAADDEDEVEESEDEAQPAVYAPHALPTAATATPDFVNNLDPRDEWLHDANELIERSTYRVHIGSMCEFPKSEGVGFSKEDLSHVTNLRKTFKAQKTLLRLCVLMAQRHEELADEIGTFATATLYVMKTILDARDQMLIRRKYGEETLQQFNALPGSSLHGERRTRLMDAITLAKAAAKTSNSKRGSGTGQAQHRSKPQSNKYTKPFNKSTSTKSHGASAGTNAN